MEQNKRVHIETVVLLHPWIILTPPLQLYDFNNTKLLSINDRSDYLI